MYCLSLKTYSDWHNSYQSDALVWESIITLALLHEFVYEFRGNNTYIIQDRTALLWVSVVHDSYEPIVSTFVVENPFATNWVDLFWLWYDPFIRILRWKLIFQSYNWKAAMSEGSKGLIYEGFSTPPHLSYYEFTKVD